MPNPPLKLWKRLSPHMDFMQGFWLAAHGFEPFPRAEKKVSGASDDASRMVCELFAKRVQYFDQCHPSLNPDRSKTWPIFRSWISYLYSCIQQDIYWLLVEILLNMVMFNLSRAQDYKKCNMLFPKNPV